jgi:hypothetical protein
MFALNPGSTKNGRLRMVMFSALLAPVHNTYIGRPRSTDLDTHRGSRMQSLRPPLSTPYSLHFEHACDPQAVRLRDFFSSSPRLRWAVRLLNRYLSHLCFIKQTSIDSHHLHTLVDRCPVCYAATDTTTMKLKFSGTPAVDLRSVRLT